MENRLNDRSGLILIVDDTPTNLSLLAQVLGDAGFEVAIATSGERAIEQVKRERPDLILLDIMMPGKDGLFILKHLRQAGRNTPVILLTARNELDDRLQGLNLGADDYIAKPFFVEELVARMNAVARRSVGERQNLVTVGPFKLDRITRTGTSELENDQQLVELTTREFNLLEYLMRSPGRVFTRTQMLEHVWGYDFNPSTNVVDVCIQRLRKKIEIKGQNRWIESVRGVGYRFRQAE